MWKNAWPFSATNWRETFGYGKDIDVISYYKTPSKALLGITVISTDFKGMGEAAAKLILRNKKEISKNPFNYIERNSL